MLLLIQQKSKLEFK